MNPNSHNKQTNNTYNFQNKALLKYKTDLIKENQQTNPQKNYINTNNYDKLDNYTLAKKVSNNKPNVNTLSQNKQIFNNSNNYNNIDKSINLSNTQDLTRHFSGNKIKKTDITNVTILSPKAQKEILNNRINNANFNENLFQKNINLNVNNQTFEGTTPSQQIKNLKINTNLTPKASLQINQIHNLVSSNEINSIPKTTKDNYNQELFLMNSNINSQINANFASGKNNGFNSNNNTNPSQNSILNDYNNLSKKLISKSKFKGNASYNPTGVENISLGNNISNSNSQSIKNTKENFSSNKISSKVNNKNTLSVNYNNPNSTFNSNLITNNSNLINRNSNASPFKNDQNFNQKNNLGISGKNMELNFSQLNSNNKNSRNKSNNHNYNSTNINVTNQSTIKNNMNNIYSTNFIDAGNNNIISRNIHNGKINFENTMKFSGTVHDCNVINTNLSSNNMQKIIKNRLENTMNLAQQGNVNRNSNSKSRFNYESLLSHAKNNLNNNSNLHAKSKSPSIFNPNKIESLNFNSLNILNTDSDLNGDQNDCSQNTQNFGKNYKSKSINLIGKNQVPGLLTNQISNANTAGRSNNVPNNQLISQSKISYNKSENVFLNQILNNPLNMKPSNATFNSSLQNRLNIYSIGSDYNSPHIVDTDGNSKNVKSHDELMENDLENNEENEDCNNYQEQIEYNTYEENDNQELVNQQTPSNENDEALDKNEYLFFKKENLYKKNELNKLQKNKIKSNEHENFLGNKTVLPNESLLMYSKNIINKKNVISGSSVNSNKLNLNSNGDSNSEHNYLISNEEQLHSNKKTNKNSNNDIRQKIKNLDLSKLKNSMDKSNIANIMNVNNANSSEVDFSHQAHNMIENNEGNLELSQGLKHRKSNDKVLFDNTNNINNIQNKTLSNISSPKMNNNKNFLFNSDKEINYNSLIKSQNASGTTGNNNQAGFTKKKSSNSQLNTSDTSSYKLNEMKLKLKSNKLFLGNNLINNLTNIKDLNNFVSDDLKNFSGENNNNNAVEHDKYVLTNNTNEDDYSVSEIGFLSSSNKVDSNGVSRNNRNKFINLEKNYLQTHIENLNSNNLIKKYQNLNELGEILDDSNEKNLKSETKEENNKNSLSFVCFDKFTQTSFDADSCNYFAKNAIEQDKADWESNAIQTENNVNDESEIKKEMSGYASAENKNKQVDSLSFYKLKKESNKNDNKPTKEYKLEIVNSISEEFTFYFKKPKGLKPEDLTKNMVDENSSKILEYLSDECFRNDIRYLKLKKDYDNLQAENERLILNEAELLKTTAILKNYIQTQEKSYFDRQKEDNSLNHLLQSRVKEAEVSLMKKEWNEMAKRNNELKLIILKMMHQINTFESEENKRNKDFYALHNQVIKENEFLRSVCENIVFPKQDLDNLNQFEKGINSRNRNGALNKNLYKTDLRMNGDGTIMKDNNSSVVHNESYAEENSFTFIEKENKKNDGSLIIIQDLNSSGILGDNSNANSRTTMLSPGRINFDDKFSNFFSDSSNPGGSKKLKKREDKNFELNEKNNDNNNKRNKDKLNNIIKSNKICYTRKKKS